MDVILDEARKRDMKVWILDDSHFPTGYANGAIEGKSLDLRRQSIVTRTVKCEKSNVEMMLPLEDIKNAQAWRPTPMEERMLKGKVPPVFDDDSIISVTAIRTDEKTEVIDLSEQIPSGKIDFKVPEGDWKLVVCYRTRNRGPHRSYINMMDAKSCKVLIDTVYEPHYQHYRDDFGTTIAGFFSDEPGNRKPDISMRWENRSVSWKTRRGAGKWKQN